MHELDYSSRSLMQLCKTRHPVLLHPARVPDSIRTATLRAAYDSPGVTDLSGILGSARRYLQWGRFHRSGAVGFMTQDRVVPGRRCDSTGPVLEVW